VHFTFTFGHERVELYLYSPYGPCGLYRASVPVQRCTLPYSVLAFWKKKNLLSVPGIKASIVQSIQMKLNNSQFIQPQKTPAFCGFTVWESWLICLIRTLMIETESDSENLVYVAASLRIFCQIQMSQKVRSKCKSKFNVQCSWVRAS